MLGHMYECRVCGESLQNLRGWRAHFLKETHLTLARKELRNWREKERSCTLVVFGLLPVSTNGIIPGQLSSRGGNRIIVTDFVWWPERPKVGFVRFENKNALEQIVTSLEKKGRKSLEHDQFNMGGNQYCHFKMASQMSEIEWLGLLPPPEAEDEVPAPDRESSPEIQEIPVPKKRKRKVVVIDLGTPKRNKTKRRCQRIEFENPRTVEAEQNSGGSGRGEQTGMYTEFRSPIYNPPFSTRHPQGTLSTLHFPQSNQQIPFPDPTFNFSPQLTPNPFQFYYPFHSLNPCIYCPCGFCFPQSTNQFPFLPQSIYYL